MTNPAMEITTQATTHRVIDVSADDRLPGAGTSDAPTLLLVHGSPSSSRVYEPLFARLADAFHLMARDTVPQGRRSRVVPPRRAQC
jgi:pimeloyl-ACP methyl ester carboxylesterase